MQFIDLKAQQKKLKTSIEQRINAVLSHGHFIMGAEVQELEQALCDYVGVKHSITCGNGTDALQLALMASDIGPGDIVFTTAFSFFATAEVIALTGATPWFIDIESDSYNICPDSLRCAIETSQESVELVPKAVIAVDLFGLPANYHRLEEICKQYNLTLIEDAAQSFGGRIGEKKCGTFGDIACTSFFPSKPLGCYGDGGAVFTDNDEIAALVRSLRIHGKGKDKYDNVRIGVNSRLDTIQAAVLLEKLTVLDGEIKQRNVNANKFTEALKDRYLTPALIDEFHTPVAQYTLRARKEDRETVLKRLSAVSIPYAIYYDKPINHQKAFVQYRHQSVPNALSASQQVFSIPCHAYLTDGQIQHIIETLNS